MSESIDGLLKRCGLVQDWKAQGGELVKVTDYNDLLKKEFHRKAEYISVKDLGEWAWRRFVELGEFDVDFFTYSGVAYSENKLLFDIAVACLGKQEVKRRLEELK